MWGGPYHWEGGAVQDGQEGPGCSGCCGEALSHDKVPSGIIYQCVHCWLYCCDNQLR